MYIVVDGAGDLILFEAQGHEKAFESVGHRAPAIGFHTDVACMFALRQAPAAERAL